MKFRDDFIKGKAVITCREQPSIHEIAEKLQKEKYDNGEIRASAYFRSIESMKKLKGVQWAYKPIGKVQKDDCSYI